MSSEFNIILKFICDFPCCNEHSLMIINKVKIHCTANGLVVVVVGYRMRVRRSTL